jgi:hypothetical protein
VRSLVVRRALAFFLPVAVLMALALAGCGNAIASATPSPPPSSAATSPEPSNVPPGAIVPWIDATPTPVPSPTLVPIPSGTLTCVPGDLAASAGWQGATGQMVGWLTLTNAEQRPCVVNGSPRLIQLRAGDAILDTVTYVAGKDAGPGTSTGVAGPVLLRPGDQAGAFLWWTNWCPEMIPAVSAVLVTLPTGGSPIVAGPASPGLYFGTPRCDQPMMGSTFTAYAFVAVPPPQPAYEPQAASVSLSVPPMASPGDDLAFTVTLTNRGDKPAVLSPCPAYTEDLIVAGAALKPPASQQFLLNCAAIGQALAPGVSVTLQMHYAVPTSIRPGPVELVWGMDPGGPLDAGTAVQRASLIIAGRYSGGVTTPTATAMLASSRAPRPTRRGGPSVD